MVFQFLRSYLLCVVIVIGHKLEEALRGPDLLAVSPNSVWVCIVIFGRYLYVPILVPEVFFNLDVVVHMLKCTFYWVLHCSCQFERLFTTSFQITVFY